MDSKGNQPYIYMYPFSPKLCPYAGFHITLNRVPWVIKQVLIVNHLVFIFSIQSDKNVTNYPERKVHIGWEGLHRWLSGKEPTCQCRRRWSTVHGVTKVLLY